MIKHLDSSEYKTMPWKNGGGTTREIFRFPAIDSWDLRVSMASVDSSGPFSSFPGMMRHLVLLTGKGMMLNDLRFDRALVPHTFSGIDQIEATLIDGPNTDFNVFWRKDLYECSIEITKKIQRKISADEFALTFNPQSLESIIVSDDQLLIENRGEFIFVLFKNLK